ncbi:hypothetical protein Sste5346_004584 [Sporothrix stenoceras]|uniref:Uncharacterized protein n=1 Tax=Sporothrix stenoceras TaxID=5173 RepID=A0ABR3Z901_9PEZI
MPRYTTPPEYDPTDIQPGEDRVPGTLKSNLKAEGLDAQPEAQAHFIEEAAAAQNEKAEPNEQAVQDEGAECGPAVSEKNVQVAAQRVSSSSSDAHPSRPIESVSNNGNDNDNGNIEAPRVSNNEQPVVVALPSQQEPAAEPVAELAAQSQPAQLPWVDHPRRFTTVFVYDPNNQPLRRPRREFRWRLPRTNAPPPVIQHLPVVVEKRRPRPIGYNTTEDYDVLAGMMDKGKVPNEVPKYMNMAFPRTVDLSVPCAYCFMKLDCTIQDAGEHIRGPPKISKGTTSRIPGKRYAVLGAKYFFAYSYYAISTALYAVTTGLDDCMSGKGELTDQEEERLDAYIDAMNETRSRSFHQWWSMQLPVTLPAVLAPGADGLYYSDGYYR